LLELSKRIGQKPLLCRKEHPGYVFNWLLQALIRSALELVDQGVATPEEIDQRWMDLSGMKKGPFWIMDQIGLDIVQQALQNSRFTQPAPAETLIRFLEKWIAAGHLGQKTGAGFYSYPTQLLDWETTLHGK
jgi:3-hydroxybutyryl-CoA dehydrogenase